MYFPQSCQYIARCTLSNSTFKPLDFLAATEWRASGRVGKAVSTHEICSRVPSNLTTQELTL